ncbi:MAG: MATE family efflux transporter [Lachnospiraceae bacterium]|jgi:putative MATE family efflux protein
MTNKQESAAREDNLLETMPMARLLVRMAAPMMISFFIQALYNIVDSIFVARISENALTAVSLAFPMQNVITAVGVGLGVGLSAALPRAAAAGDGEHADALMNTDLFLSTAVWAVFFLLGVFASRPYFSLQTNVAEIGDGGTIYLRICWMASFGALYGQILEKALVATGHSLSAMVSQATGAVFNIVFDPLLIFGIGIFPRMGIAGAAAATVLGQILGASVALFFNLKFNSQIHIGKNFFRPSGKAAGQIVTVGFPSMITIGLSSAMSFLVNQVLLTYSTTATAVYGIWLKLQNFCFMPAFGLNNGLVPILSYNYARKNRERVHTAMRMAFSFIFLLMLALTVILEFIPGPLLALFSATDNMMAIGKPAIRICVLSLVFGGMNVVGATAMQAMDHPGYTLVINILRQFALIVALFYLLSVIFHQLDILWISVPIGEAVTMIVMIVLFRKNMKVLDG